MFNLQVYQPNIQKRRLAFAKHKHVRSGILRYLKTNALGRLLDDHGQPNREVLYKLVDYHLFAVSFNVIYKFYKYITFKSNLLQTI